MDAIRLLKYRRAINPEKSRRTIALALEKFYNAVPGDNPITMHWGIPSGIGVGDITRGRAPTRVIVLHQVWGRLRVRCIGLAVGCGWSETSTARCKWHSSLLLEFELATKVLSNFGNTLL